MRDYGAFLGLLGDAAQGHADFLDLDDAGRLIVDEQQVIARPSRQRELAHRHTEPGAAVELGAVLRYPAGGGEQRVDGLAGKLFRGGTAGFLVARDGV